MSPLTQQGKGEALEALLQRRARFKDAKLPDNAGLPAGSPMFFRCVGCGSPIVVPEGYSSRPDACDECASLVKLGWIE